MVLSERISALSCWLDGNLHWIYLSFAIPLVTLSALLVPPLRVPDEPWHLIRAAHISNAGFVERAVKGIVGGDVDPGMVEFNSIAQRNIPRAVKFLEKRKIFGIKWKHSDQWIEIRGTTRYAPFLYLPQAIAFVFSRSANLTVLNSFYVARIANGLCAVATVCIAIALCRRGKLFLFCIALLPMAVFMMGSLSQDAGVIALSLLVAALITRGSLARARDYLILASAIALLAVSRMPLIGLGLLLWLPMWRLTKVISLRGQLITSICVAFFFFTWLELTVWLQGPVQSGAQAAPQSQLAFLRAHPIEVVSAPLDTVVSDYRGWYRMFIGQLGWLDLVLPDLVLAGGGALVLAGAFVCSAEPAERNSIDAILTFIASAGSLLVFMWILYLTWSPVGSLKVVGMQGRYLFSFIPLFAVIIPKCALGNKRFFAPLKCALTILCIVAVPTLMIFTIDTIQRHYRIAAIYPAARSLGNGGFLLG